MTKLTIEPEKVKVLNDLLTLYQKEVQAIYGIGHAWRLLKDEAKDRCAEDFDHAIIARETYLEELLYLKDVGIDTEPLEDKLHSMDKQLLENNKIIKEIYGLDVKAFLNLKKPKGLPKPGR